MDEKFIDENKILVLVHVARLIAVLFAMVAICITASAAADDHFIYNKFEPPSISDVRNISDNFLATGSLHDFFWIPAIRLE
jgi:hypothetical protein